MLEGRIRLGSRDSRLLEDARDLLELSFAVSCLLGDSLSFASGELISSVNLDFLSSGLFGAFGACFGLGRRESCSVCELSKDETESLSLCVLRTAPWDCF